MHKTDLLERRKNYEECMKQYKAKIVVCGGTGCMANGSMIVFERIREIVKAKGVRETVAIEKQEAVHNVRIRLPGLLPDGAAGYDLSSGHNVRARKAGRRRGYR